MFAAYGLPEQVVSDNGSQFTFVDFMKGNGIKHIKSTPYHPSTNRLAERFVQTFKRALMKDFGHRPVHHQLTNFLLSYCSLPHATTNCTPSKSFLKRELRTRMDLMRLESNVKLGKKQGLQKLDHDCHSNQESIMLETALWLETTEMVPKWMAGVVVERKAPLSYVVQMDHGMLWRHHVDQLRTGMNIAQSKDIDVPPPDKVNNEHYCHSDFTIHGKAFDSLCTKSTEPSIRPNFLHLGFITPIGHINVHHHESHAPNI